MSHNKKHVETNEEPILANPDEKFAVIHPEQTQEFEAELINKGFRSDFYLKGFDINTIDGLLWFWIGQRLKPRRSLSDLITQATIRRLQEVIEQKRTISGLEFRVKELQRQVDAHWLNQRLLDEKIATLVDYPCRRAEDRYTLSSEFGYAQQAARSDPKSAEKMRKYFGLPLTDKEKCL